MQMPQQVISTNQPFAAEVSVHPTTHNAASNRTATMTTSATSRQRQAFATPPVPRPPLHDPSRCFRVPLPPGTDDYCDPITIRGVSGLRCRDCPKARRMSANAYICAEVDRVGVLLDSVFPEGEVYVHRGWFACDPKPHFLFTSKTSKDPREGFKRVHLLSMMVDKQYRSWFCRKFLEGGTTKDLQDLVGPTLAPTRGIRVKWEAIHLVAVRRWRDRRGRYHYFPEIEVRI
ncbi:hypothetical protein OH77DRAFT_1519206 [Trametes cingulata]|nr:hypothetical protein OH77DRAFT_1519206 [Trametes cingulata]